MVTYLVSERAHVLDFAVVPGACNMAGMDKAPRF